MVKYIWNGQGEDAEMKLNPGWNLITLKPYPDTSKAYLDYRQAWADACKGITPDYPLNLDLEIARSCALKCPFCPREYLAKDEKYGLMKPELAKKAIDQGAGKVPAIKFNWLGESLLHPALADIVFYAKSKGYIDLLLNTSGFNLNEKLAKNLIEAGLTQIIFSIDSIDKDRYERARVGAKFETTLNNVKKLVELRGDRKFPYIRAQKVNLNPSENEAYIAFWKEIGVDAIGINSLKDKNPATPRTAPEHCPMPFQRLFVDFKGRYHGCCADNFNEYLLGNIKYTTICEAWHDIKQEKLRKASLENRLNEFSQCRKCDLEGGK